MARTGWLVENEFRDYPFIPTEALASVGGGSDVLPTSAIVDFGAMLGMDAEFEEDLHQVYLGRIWRDDGLLYFEFHADSPGIAGIVLLFTRSIDDPPHVVQYANSSDDSLSSASLDDCTGAPLWEGFLITGPLEDLLELLPGDGQLNYADGRWQVEPGRLQVLSYLRSLNLANYDRTRAQDCCEEEEEDEERIIWVNAVCLTGDLRFVEGFSCSIRQEDSTNSIIIGGAIGSGAGLSCEEVPLYPGESPQGGSALLSGGPQCSDLVKTINGVGGPSIQLVAGRGVRIGPHETDPHTLVVDVHLQDFTLCPDAS